MFLVDSWNGDLMCEFNTENFYKYSSLHAIFDLTIHRSTWSENGGCLDPKDENAITAKEQLESRIQEIANARFSPEIQEIMSERISAKLENLDPKDAYYQENKQELLFVTDHFGLEELNQNLIKKDSKSNEAIDTTNTLNTKDSFVEKLGLEKSEHEESFVKRLGLDAIKSGHVAEMKKLLDKPAENNSGSR